MFARPGPQRLPSPSTIATRRLLRWLNLRRDVVLAPLAAAVVVALLAEPGDRARGALLTCCMFAIGAGMGRRVAAQAGLLPLMRHVFPLLGPVLGATGVALAEVLTDTPGVGPLDLLAAVAAAFLTAQPWAGVFGAPAPGTMRAAFIGPPAGAGRLQRALEVGGSHQLMLVGRVACREDDDTEPQGVPALGPLSDLAAVVTEHDIDLLVMGAEAPRLTVFSEVTNSCLDLPVRLVELSALFEEVFGHVPMAEINAAWFQCLADPHARTSSAPFKRVIDVTGACVALVLAAPVLPLLFVLIRRDGGPAIFTQVRIGEGGRRLPPAQAAHHAGRHRLVRAVGVRGRSAHDTRRRASCGARTSTSSRSS